MQIVLMLCVVLQDGCYEQSQGQNGSGQGRQVWLRAVSGALRGHLSGCAQLSAARAAATDNGAASTEAAHTLCSSSGALPCLLAHLLMHFSQALHDTYRNLVGV